MREYTLRDKELLKKLEDIWPHFENKLRTASRNGDYYDGVKVDVGGDIWLTFDWSVLDLVKAYDPNGWNDFPEVLPPEEQVMIIQSQNAKTGLISLYSAYYKKLEGEWFISDTAMQGNKCPVGNGNRVIRFRSLYE